MNEQPCDICTYTRALFCIECIRLKKRNAKMRCSEHHIPQDGALCDDCTEKQLFVMNNQ